MPRIFSDQAKLDCLKRELRMRRRVHPKLIELVREAFEQALQSVS